MPAENGPFSKATHEFLEGLKAAQKAGLTYEYVEWFLDEYKQHGDGKKAKIAALLEWDI